ncbi:MAG: hypothetical protein QOD94_35 [Alphaproteobacteria bacterium]|nr:hypothetical protein [Alphaproteobacteria bacterium]
MCALLRYSAGGLAALLMTAYVAVSAESGLSAFRPTVIEPAGAAQTTIVNRMIKGDRELTARDVRVPTSANEKRKPAAAKEPKILEGCDPAFSPLMASAKNNFASRCLT